MPCPKCADDFATCDRELPLVRIVDFGRRLFQILIIAFSATASPGAHYQLIRAAVDDFRYAMGLGFAIPAASSNILRLTIFSRRVVGHYLFSSWR